MSNGAQCCALEICCDPPALREKLPALVADCVGHGRTIAHEEAVRDVLDWMAHEGLVFAPESFRQVIKDIATAARKHHP